jgi:hypothetical protein
VRKRASLRRALKAPELRFFEPGTDFKNIFAKNFSENIGVFAQTTASFCKIVIITLVFEKNANFFAENWQKSPKILIITSTPGSGLD